MMSVTGAVGPALYSQIVSAQRGVENVCQDIAWINGQLPGFI